MKLYDNWNRSEFDAQSYTDSQRDARSSSRNNDFGFESGGRGGFMGIGSYDVVGLNVNKIPSMREAIQTYVKDIMTHLENINALNGDGIVADNAFKSEDVQKAVDEYINKVKKYCMNLVSQLMAFSDKLKDVEEAYQANMAKMASGVNDTAGAFSAGDEYTLQK